MSGDRILDQPPRNHGRTGEDWPAKRRRRQEKRGRARERRAWEAKQARQAG